MSLEQKKAMAMASARARAADAAPKLGQKDVPDMPVSPPQGNFGKPDENDSIVDKVRGALGAGATIASGATTGLLGDVGGILGGLAGQVRQGEIGSPEGAARVVEGAKEAGDKLSYRQTSPKSDEYLEKLDRAFDATKLQGVGPGEATLLSRTPARAAARQVGKTLAPEAGALKAIPGKIADVVTPKPSPELAALAKKAEDLGIELRPDMLANNKIAKFIGEALEQVPISGSKAEQRQMAFNSALTKIIGGDPKARRLTPDVYDRAMTASGEKIGQISKETPITVNEQMQKTLLDRVAQAEKFETGDVAKIVKNYADELWKSAGVDGVIPGETFRKINSKIGRQIRTTSNGDLKAALGELQEDMHDALQASIKSPERLAELKDARYRYAMGKMIEPLVAKAKGGDISPSALMSAVTATGDKKAMMARGKGGDIGDLARIGQAFLKEPPSAGTGERVLGYSLLGGSAFAEPMTATGIVSAANLYNRLGPKLTKRAINMREVDPQVTQPWNIGIP